MRLIEEMSPEWDDIGRLIGISKAKLLGYRSQCMNNYKDCMKHVAGDWMEMCSEKVRIL